MVNIFIVFKEKKFPVVLFDNNISIHADEWDNIFDTDIELLTLAFAIEPHQKNFLITIFEDEKVYSTQVEIINCEKLNEGINKITVRKKNITKKYFNNRLFERFSAENLYGYIGTDFDYNSHQDKKIKIMDISKESIGLNLIDNNEKLLLQLKYIVKIDSLDLVVKGKIISSVLNEKMSVYVFGFKFLEILHGDIDKVIENYKFEQQSIRQKLENFKKSQNT